MKSNLHRHCERSEAIHLGLPRRLRLLAMTMAVFSTLLISSPAFACDKPDYKEAINLADIVFEGHLVAFEKKDVTVDVGMVSFEEGKVNRDKIKQPKPETALVESYHVDKAWKGVEDGQVIKLVNHYKYSGAVPSAADHPVKGIFALSHDQVLEEGKPVSRFDMCPNRFSQSIRPYLAEKFPVAER